MLPRIAWILVVTGPKTDLWLVKTVGVRRITDEIILLAAGSALGLAIIDVVSTRHISSVYLADAVAELGLVALWAVGRVRA